jgi:hypothetical protein
MESPLRSRETLYRRILLCATCALLLANAAAQGGQRDARGNPTQDKQTPSTPYQYGKRKGPRAIAVVRWDADVKDRAVPVLVPVTILDDGKFYDAGVYKAAPAPMPLLVGTVYEAQDKGELLGYFTIKNQAQTPEKKNWIALGAWESAAPPMDKFADNRTTSAEVVRGPLTENTGASPGDNSDDRDLNKKKTTVYDENGKPMPEGTQASPAAPMGGSGKDQPRIQPSNGSAKSADASKPADSKKSTEDTDRPTLKRQADSTAQPVASSPPTQNTPDSSTSATAPPVSSTTATSSDDPDRPQLKRGKPATRTAPGGLPQLVDKDTDADRPVIRRNNGKSDQKKEEGIPVPPRVLARGPLLGEGGGDEPTLKRTRTYEAVAVSDANVDQPTSFRYKMTSDEKERLQSKMDALAQEEVDKYLKSIGRARAGAPTAAQSKPKRATASTRRTKATTPAPAAKSAPAARSLFVETQFEVLDLSHRNDAVLVFSGREREESAGSAAQDVYVTYVARIDYEGNPHGIFRSVTVNDRLDVTPKLELIDAVDAKGDSNGELLFRRVSDQGAEFAIYKVTYDGMTEMFHGGVAD